MPERRLHQVNRRAPIERVGSMRVAHPVRRDVALDAGTARRCSNYPADLTRVQRPAAAGGSEQRIIGAALP